MKSIYIYTKRSFTNTHYILIFIILCLLAFSRAVYATGGGAVHLDCNQVGSSCEWPTVGIMTYFGQNGSDSDASAGRCTVSLIHKDAIKFVVLTAGHCADLTTLFESIGIHVNGLGVTFDPVVDMQHINTTNTSVRNIFIRGGVPIHSPKFFSWLSSGLGAGTAANGTVYDIGAIAFPRNALNLLGETLDNRYGDIQPVALLGNDTNFKIEDLVNSLPKDQSFIATQVGYGTTDDYRGFKPFLDKSTFGNRNVGPIILFHLYKDRVIYDNRTWFDNANTASGDSGSPQFYEINGIPFQLSVLSYGNAPWGNANGTDTVPTNFSGTYRLDNPDAISFVNCIRNAQGADFQAQVAYMQNCVNGIR